MNEMGSWDREEHVRQSKCIDIEVIMKLRGLEIPTCKTMNTCGSP